MVTDINNGIIMMTVIKLQYDTNTIRYDTDRAVRLAKNEKNDFGSVFGSVLRKKLRFSVRFRFS